MARIATAAPRPPSTPGFRQRRRERIPWHEYPGPAPSIRRRIRASLRSLWGTSIAPAIAIARLPADARHLPAPCAASIIAVLARRGLCARPIDVQKTSALARPIRCASVHAPQGTASNRSWNPPDCRPHMSPLSLPTTTPHTSRQRRQRHTRAPRRAQIAIRRLSRRATRPRYRRPSGLAPQAGPKTDRSFARPHEAPPTNTPVPPHKGQALSPRTVDAIRCLHARRPRCSQRRRTAPTRPFRLALLALLALVPSRHTLRTRPRQRRSPVRIALRRGAPKHVAATRPRRPTQAALVS